MRYVLVFAALALLVPACGNSVPDDAEVLTLDIKGMD